MPDPVVPADRASGPNDPTSLPASVWMEGDGETDAPVESVADTGTAVERPAFRTGAPAWMDLTSHDLEAARRFYGELFGWTFIDEGEGFGHYHRVLLGDAVIAGIVPARDQDGDPASPEDLPARWAVYLAAEDVDATASAVVEAGGGLIVPPTTIPGMGRMAYVEDPLEVEFGLWQGGDLRGFEAMGAPGDPVWFECMSGDTLVAEQFYRDALEWQMAVMPGSGDAGFWYATDRAGADAAAGLCDASAFLPRGEGGYWRMYIAVEDVDGTLERVRELGGSVLDGPMDSPFGRLATVADTEGASFQVIRRAVPGEGADTAASAGERAADDADAPAADVPVAGGPVVDDADAPTAATSVFVAEGSDGDAVGAVADDADTAVLPRVTADGGDAAHDAAADDEAHDAVADDEAHDAAADDEAPRA